MFCLSSGNLTVAEAADRFRQAAGRIEMALHEGPGLWLVYGDGRIDRTWP